MKGPLKSLSATKRGILLFSSGTAVAQLITVLFAIALTRFYSPAEFGVFALFVSLSTIGGALAGGRYEIAIVIPKEEDHARSIVKIACGVAFLSCLALGGILALGFLSFREFFEDGQNWVYCIALPFNIWLIHLLNTLNHWSNRHRRYRVMAGIAVFQALTINTLSIGFSYIAFGAYGLVYGVIVGRIFTALALLIQGMTATERVAILGSNWETVVSNAKKFQNHPKHLLPSLMIGAVATQMPVFTMSTFFESTVVGYYTLAQRFVTLPTTTMAKAVAEIYRERVGKRVRNGKPFRDLFLKTFFVMSLIGGIASIIIFIFAPQVFDFILGEAWFEAGSYVRILLIAAFFQFVFTPVDKGAAILGETGFIFKWQSWRLLSTFVVFGLIYLTSADSRTALFMIVGAVALMYLINGIANFRFSVLSRAD